MKLLSFLSDSPLFAYSLIAMVITGSIILSFAESMSSANSEGELKPAGFAVVELFTSQGCSSCPPADRNLSELAREYRDKPVYLLSFHVDYWDYLGWKDPFSDKNYSDRQRRYATAFRSSRIYTPQMVVNGSQEFVGSRRGEARSNIDRALGGESRAAALAVSVRPDGQTAHITVDNLPDTDDLMLNVALVQRAADNEVNRGENRGRHLSHANVVRDFESIRLDGKSTESSTLTIPVNVSLSNLECIAYLQDRQTMQVTLAGRTELPKAGMSSSSQ